MSYRQYKRYIHIYTHTYTHTYIHTYFIMFLDETFRHQFTWNDKNYYNIMINIITWLIKNLSIIKFYVVVHN
jgi:hypothetical protein